MTLAFRIERDALALAAAMVARVAGKAGWTTGMRLDVEGDKIRLACTDLDVSMTTTLAVAGEGDGSVVAPAKRFAEMVRALREGAVTVEAADAALRLKSGPSSGSLPLITGEPFPGLPEPPEGRPVDAKALRAALAQVTPAASHDQARPILTGVLFDPGEGGTLTLVATDSYRLHLTTLACDWHGGPALVPALALRELLRLPETDTLLLAADDNAITFTVGETVLSARLLEGEFPRYRQLIPAEGSGRLLEVDREELVEALQRVDVVRNERNMVRLDIDGMSMRLSAASEDGGENAGDELAVEWGGSAETLHFSWQFLTEALAAVGTERAALMVNGPLRPATVRAVPADDFLGLVMPVRV